MVREEVEDQRNVCNRARHHHALGGLRVQLQAVPDSSNQRDLFAETKHFSCLRHGGLQFAKSLHQIVVVGALGHERGQYSHDEVLDDTARLVAADARVDDVRNLLEEDEERVGHF